MTRTAYLRVYLPVDAVEAAGVPEPPRHVPDRRPDNRLRVTDYGLLSESLQDDALFANWQGRRFVCPRMARVRVLEGVLAFHNAYSDVGGEAVIPESVARRAAKELRSLVEGEPLARSYILTSPWHVPLRWFVAFDAGQRELTDGAGHPSIRYRTRRHQASERIDRAVAVLREAGLGDAVVDEVEELGNWLGGFPEEALVELDYGEVATMFEGPELALDESAAEVWGSIEALAHEDWESAGRAYSSVATRWAPALAVTWSN